MQVAYALYDDFTMLDIVGPFNVLSVFPDLESVWVAEAEGPVVDHTRTGALVACARFDDVVEPDIVVIPGGLRTSAHFDGPLVSWVRSVHPKTKWTTSVCTGSLLLASAGLLDGLEATTHWAARDQLAKFGATVSSERVVMHPEARLVTAAGVSAGIDMALSLLTLLKGDVAAQLAQLAIEYDPNPPVDAGSIEKAPPAILELARMGFKSNG